MTRPRAFRGQARPDLTFGWTPGLQDQCRACQPAGTSLSTGVYEDMRGPFPESYTWWNSPGDGERTTSHASPWCCVEVVLEKFPFSQHSHYLAGDRQPNLRAPPIPWSPMSVAAAAHPACQAWPLTSCQEGLPVAGDRLALPQIFPAAICPQHWGWGSQNISQAWQPVTHTGMQQL